MQVIFFNKISYYDRKEEAKVKIEDEYLEPV